MTIKVYDSKVYGKTVYMRYGKIEGEGCTANCVGCTMNIAKVPLVFGKHRYITICSSIACVGASSE